MYNTKEAECLDLYVAVTHIFLFNSCISLIFVQFNHIYFNAFGTMKNRKPENLVFYLLVGIIRYRFMTCSIP